MLTMRRDPAQNEELPKRREPGGVLMVLPHDLEETETRRIPDTDHEEGPGPKRRTSIN